MKSDACTITHYLMGGERRGCIKCSCKVWSAVAYKMPRVLVSKCSDVEGLKGGGVYFLFGEDEDGKPTIYVGKASARVSGIGMTQRILESHGKSAKTVCCIDDWAYAVALTTKSDEFGATELGYLEYSFHQLAIQAKRCVVLNGNTPHKGAVPEEESANVHAYMECAKELMESLGVYAFTPVTSAGADSSCPVLRLKHPESEGRGCYTEEGFIVFKGSKLRMYVPPTCPKSALRAREFYADKIKDGVLMEDLLFSSPSSAAAFVGSGSINGWEKWQTEDGKSLKEIMPK